MNVSRGSTLLLLERYGFSLLVVGLIFGFRCFIHSFFPTESPVVYVGFGLAIAICSFLWGMGPGIFATFLSALLGSVFFMRIHYPMDFPLSQWVHVSLFLLEGGAICFGATRLSLFQHNLTEKIAELSSLKTHLTLEKTRADQAVKTKDEFLAALSHELRTPLIPIFNGINLLEENLDLQMTPEIQTVVDMIRRNLDIEVHLIEDLLDITKIRLGRFSLKMETIDLRQPLRLALEICHQEIAQKQISVSMDLQSINHYVLADSARMTQVFWNVLQNAVKFTPEEGTIEIRDYNIENTIVVEICDSGEGIDPDFLSSIFTAFEQDTKNKQTHTAQKGLGLGLAITQSILRNHGGTINAYSGGKGVGSTFTIELASIARPAITKSKEISPPIRGFPGKENLKILLIEDHLDTRHSLERLLKSRGYSIESAENVKQALAVFKTNPEINLMISDIGLPDGSGLEVFAQALKIRPIKGIALSGYGREEDIERSKAAGFHNHLVKPVTIDRLEKGIQETTLA